MNRSQRRAAMRADKRRGPMLQKQDTPVQIQHAHTDEHYAMIFSRPVDRIFMTPEQAEKFIEAVHDGLRRLAEHKAKVALPAPAMAANDAPVSEPAANG